MVYVDCSGFDMRDGCPVCFGFCFKQKTAYERRISYWSSDVCSSDLAAIVCASLVARPLGTRLPPTLGRALSAGLCHAAANRLRMAACRVGGRIAGGDRKSVV